MQKAISELVIKKVREGKINDFKNWDILLPNSVKLKHDILTLFLKSKNTVEINLDIEVKNPYVSKTNKQLGYLHAAIYKPIYQFYKEAGLDYSEEQIRNQIKMHPAINFVDELYNPMDGVSERIPKSMADASKEEAMQHIDRLIIFCAEIGLVIEEPEVYRIRNGIKREDWNKWNE